VGLECRTEIPIVGRERAEKFSDTRSFLKKVKISVNGYLLKLKQYKRAEKLAILMG